MDDIAVPMSTAVSIAAALITSLLLLPFPFLWPWRAQRRQKRMSRRSLFWLLSGVSAYLLIGVLVAILAAIAMLLRTAGIGPQMSLLQMFFDHGWFAVATVIVLVSIWVTHFYQERWRELLERWSA